MKETELANWKMLLRNWRERNGYTSPEWTSYVEAISTQETIFGIALCIVMFAFGYLVGISGFK